MTAKEINSIVVDVMECRVLISEIEASVIERAEDGYSWISIPSVVEKESKAIEAIKSYFEHRGFRVTANYHSKPEYRDFTIGW